MALNIFTVVTPKFVFLVQLCLLIFQLVYPTARWCLWVGDLCFSSMSKSCHVQNELLIFLLEAFS